MSLHPDRYDAEGILSGLLRWVEIDTPTGEVPGMSRLLDRVAGDFAPLGAAMTRIPGRDGLGDHLLVRMPWGSGPGILSVAHLDTVCVPGTVRTGRDGERCYGPGIADMKGGAFLTLEAARRIAALPGQAPLPFTVLFTSDEEIGSPTSRDVIADLSRDARFALIAEPARRDEVVTVRKGRAKYRIDVTGRAAHAGSAHGEGRSAVSELARHIVALDGLTDDGTGTTINVGEIGGGTATNVVAERAFCHVDLRFSDNALGVALDRTIHGLRPIGRDMRITVTGEIEKPCLERSAATLELFEIARRLCAEAGIALSETGSGGGSDGNFTAAYGVPTLDGLGVIGNTWHSPDEHIVVPALPRRAALMEALLRELGR
ncbi:M20 family metallopeptidase [Methylobacterium terricola]|uniref:M20 family metallopeptidase n=2 Tax=Methylobacterium terricola TaxID=2583531 RepID=A0A5C4LA03_9HYPH|nr:M20 family metallopeptidase [Methylobacterium terricola]